MPDALDMTGRNSSWLRSRIGHLTGSNMKKVVVYSKGGFRRASQAVREKHMMEIVAERMVDAATDHFVTEAMQHGLDYEAEAIAEYERYSGFKVQPAEFMLHPTIPFFGGTPDGLVNGPSGRGGVEIKCPTTTTYVSWKLSKKPPEEHMPQLVSYLCITGRDWWDLVAYDPRVKIGLPISAWDYEPKKEDLEFVEEEAKLFLDQVELIFRQVTES